MISVSASASAMFIAVAGNIANVVQSETETLGL